MVSLSEPDVNGIAIVTINSPPVNSLSAAVSQGLMYACVKSLSAAVSQGLMFACVHYFVRSLCMHVLTR